ncbi:hypothetical protein GCM10007049_13530 [Echinicola pacifica]|uniref:histidine kinase n=1 Tax=Echinicola pacifica TaxID=346377 RepID=A0A918PTB9_9BACT|nr:PAS domain-containing protein [Echinicola pacifica]GGZ22042.1 hypothetical protein GCM10007049_13530 [Echinicola pacifica]
MLEDISWFYVSISLIPAIFNMGILGYILWLYPSKREVNVFLLFLVTLIVWQLQDTAMRLNISSEQAVFFSRSMDFGWKFICIFMFHFIALHIGNKYIRKRLFLASLYGITVILYVCYMTDVSNIPMMYDSRWGFIPVMRDNWQDVAGRAWISFLALICLGALLYAYFSPGLTHSKRTSLMALFLGGIFPVVQGITTQLIFPLFGATDVPVTSTSITLLSVAAVVALGKYQLFDFSSAIQSETIVNQIENGVIILSPDLRMIYINPSAKELLGCDQPGTLPRSMSEFFDSEDRYAEFVKDIREQVANKEKSTYQNVTLRSLIGDHIHVLFTASPFDFEKNQNGIILLLNNVTELRMAASVISLYDKRYNFVRKASDEAVWEWYLTQNEFSWSENYNELFGHNLHNGRSSLEHWVDNIHPDDRDRVVKKIFAHTQKASDERWEDTYRYRKADGSFAHVFDKGYLVFDENKEAVRMVGTMQDVTNVKSYIEKIENQNRELSEITWMQSHEVRAPLTRLMAISSYIKEFGVEQEVDVNLMDEIMVSCKELDDVIHKIVEKVDKVRHL